ncbi:MAG TPA: DNA-3-methyladenine glycosylase I [Candidatus Bathyarchaeia archaeon]|nr:DNA-3-methyladenine glycosylase I [Candidatus Bathyarchaeia archaeon]
MSPAWKITKPKNDAGYFERMTKSVFNAGLTWTVVEKKWPNFRRSFTEFSPLKVARFSEKDIKALMKNEGIVRNEKKIRATVHNAGQFLKLEKEFGSFPAYLESFGKDEERLQTDLQERFQHVGPSTARTFLWAVDYKLTPNAEEKKWMAAHKTEK